MSFDRSTLCLYIVATFYAFGCNQPQDGVGDSELGDTITSDTGIAPDEDAGVPECSPLTVGQPCDDGDPCTVGDVCSDSGGCQGLSSRVCDDVDLNPCTDPVCDSFSTDLENPCVEIPLDSDTVKGACYQYQCEEGEVVSTTPSETNDCASWIAPVGGCIDQYVCDDTYTGLEGSHCRPVGKLDGAACTPNDGGAVVPSNVAATPNVPSVCSLHVCVRNTPGEAALGLPNCVDSSALTSDERAKLSSAGVKLQHSCDLFQLPGFVSHQCNAYTCGCSDESCSMPECIVSPKSEMLGQACNEGDQCNPATCVPAKSGQAILSCETSPGAGLECDLFPDATCDVSGACDPLNGCPASMDQAASDANCVAAIPCVDQAATTCDPASPSADPVTGCVVVLKSTKSPCTDEFGDPCVTLATCEESLTGLACIPTTWLDCNDDNPCTSDACAAGDCYSTVVSGPCSDGDECTVDDECVDGTCQGALIQCDNGVFCDGAEVCVPGVGCQPGTEVELADGIGCTLDFCDEATGQVLHTPDDGACSDGQYCNGQETCNASSGCVPGVAPALDDDNPCTLDACDEQADMVTHTADSSACDDGQYCNGVETCASSGCVPGVAPTLDDGNPCTIDACDEQADMVTHTADSSACDDGQYCNGVETCNASSGCVPGVAPILEDGVSCTQDVCNEQTDSIDHIPNDLACPAANTLCTQWTCQPQQGCVLNTLSGCCGNGIQETGEACDDGNDASGDGCSSVCEDESDPCVEAGYWVGDVFWQKAELTENATCLGEYYTHADAVAACAALGSGWTLPSISMADALLNSMSAAEEDDWFPLSGNGGTTCSQMQAGGNGVWWLSDHNGASGGAAVFCNSGGCYTTGTQMGDSYLYHVRCVKTGCAQGSTAPGCPSACEEPGPEPEPVPQSLVIADNGANTVWTYALSGGPKSAFVQDIQYPIGVAYAPNLQRIFWSSYTGQKINYRGVSGTPVQSFSTPGSNPAALDFDPQGQKLYWTETVGKALRRSDPDGGNIQTIVSGAGFGIGLDLDVDTGKVYWSEETANRIRSANLDGSGQQDVVTSGIGQPRGLEVYAGDVYWADRTSQTVRRRGLSGGAVQTLATGFTFVQDIAISPADDVMYVVDDGIAAPGIVYTVPLSGGAKTTLIPSLGNPKHIIIIP